MIMVQAQQETGYAQVGGLDTEFVASHRQGNDSPAVMTFALAVPVSVEDLTVVLWAATNGDGRDAVLDTLADEAYVRRLLAEMLFGIGGDGIEDARLALADAAPGSWDAERADLVRPVVRRLIAAQNTARRARRARTARQVPTPRTAREA
ncbi:hypothetical protein GCM10022222_40290 [Amycolatopsis ultiminotia]|uniref:Uncharacterized protein n=1 Tax=Amycolatopsis ultiminotia TaxID=543629 RepID=A0ABP6WMZ1_9PSEU